jgi:hypothetical protein
VQLRLSEVGSQLGNLITFDRDAISDCVLGRLAAGEDLWAAGYNCRSSQWPILTLRMLT